MNTNFKYVYSAKFPMRFNDLNLAGLVSNTKYFEYFDESFTNWFLEFGNKLDIPITDTVICYADCQFLKELPFPGAIDIKLYVGELEASQFVVKYRLFVEDELHAEGTNKVMFIDASTNESAPIPEIFRNYIDTISP